MTVGVRDRQETWVDSLQEQHGFSDAVKQQLLDERDHVPEEWWGDAVLGILEEMGYQV